MAKITYDNKVTLNPQPSIADINKVTDADMNEIKTSVNTLYDNQGDLNSLTTTEKSNLVGAVNEVNNLKPVTLYDNSTGTTSGINNLNDNVSNYNYLEIFYKYNGTESSTKISGTKASLITHYTSNNQTYINFKEVSFSGTSMTVNSYQQWNNTWGTSGVSAANNNNILVTKILGYK